MLTNKAPCRTHFGRPARAGVKARVANVESPPATTYKAKYYTVTQEQRDAFRRDGFVHIEGVMSNEEMETHIDPVYHKFLNGEIEVPGKDRQDVSISASEDRTPENYVLHSVRLPRKYYPAWKNNLLEKKAADIACQLLETEEVELDFDQILAKRPRSRDSGMPWHQDAAYWPDDLDPDECSTANMWVAVSDSPVESGCLRYVPGSHREGKIRPHETVGPENAHLIKTDIRYEKAVMIPMRRGDIVVHNERVVHGSGPNMSDKWRCGYILNFKPTTCVFQERELGITHSANDETNWLKLKELGRKPN